MKIHFYTKGGMAAGSSRYRVLFTSRELHKLGIESTITEPPHITDTSDSVISRLFSRLRYINGLLTVPRDEIIYLQRTVHSNAFAALVALLKLIFRKRIVLDFCDPLFLLPDLRPRILFMLRFVDAAIVADEYAHSYVSRYAKRVFLVPMALPLELVSIYRTEYRDSQKPIIGWLGNGPDHYENLKIIAPALETLALEGVSFRFRLIGALQDERIHKLFSIAGVDVDIRDDMDWSNQATVYKEIAHFDLGVVPSVDTQWFRVKTFLKPIEMMALGVPTLVSDVGVTSKLIVDGHNGFKVGPTSQDWSCVLKRVLSLSAQERKKIGEQAFQTIEKNRSLAAHSKRLIDQLSTI